MSTMSCSAVERQKVDFRTMAMRCFRSSVAISPAKKSVTAMFGNLGVGGYFDLFTFCFEELEV